jgi:hypothetical protein
MLVSVEGTLQCGASLKLVIWEPTAAQVSTVDAFQGGEKEIILLSCCRTSALGFTASSNRYLPPTASPSTSPPLHLCFRVDGYKNGYAATPRVNPSSDTHVSVMILARLIIGAESGGEMGVVRGRWARGLSLVTTRDATCASADRESRLLYAHLVLTNVGVSAG